MTKFYRLPVGCRFFATTVPLSQTATVRVRLQLKSPAPAPQHCAHTHTSNSLRGGGGGRGQKDVGAGKSGAPKTLRKYLNYRRKGRWRETRNARFFFEETCAKTQRQSKNAHISVNARPALSTKKFNGVSLRSPLGPCSGCRFQADSLCSLLFKLIRKLTPTFKKLEYLRAK